jgi:heat shock protein HslJ
VRSSIRTLIAVAALGLSVAASAAAQSTDPASADPSMPTMSPVPSSGLTLEGMPWHLREFRNEDGGMTGAADGAWILLQDGILTGSTGCNDLAGSYMFDGTALTVSDITPTDATCLDGGLVAQEMAVLGRLAEVASVATDDGDLWLVDASGGQHLMFIALQGRTWTPLYAGAEPMPEGDVSVRFENGAVGGQGPCGSFGGPFTQDGSSIAIGPLESTRMSCTDPELEDELLSDLELARSYAIETGDLVLFDEQGAALRSFTDDRGDD